MNASRTFGKTSSDRRLIILLGEISYVPLNPLTLTTKGSLVDTVCLLVWFELYDSEEKPVRGETVIVVDWNVHEKD